MYRGHKLLEVARHVTCYGESSSSNELIESSFDRPSWRKLHFLNERFREADLYTQSRYHDTLNHKYPSVEAYTKVLEVVLIGDIKPKMKMREFKFDEVRPKMRAFKFDNFKHIITGIKTKPPPKRMPPKGTWGDDDSIWDREGKCGLYHI